MAIVLLVSLKKEAPKKGYSKAKRHTHMDQDLNICFFMCLESWARPRFKAF